MEATVIASITILLGLALMFISFGWSQVFVYDLGKKTDEHVQSFRSLLVIESINYTETSKEIIIRNVSKWRISLTTIEVEILRNNELTSRVHERVDLAKDESAHLPIPVACVRGENLTIRVKYIPTALLEKGFPILVAEQNFTCPISTVSAKCNLPSKWALIDVVDPVTTPSGDLSQIYPIIWIRSPLGSIVDEETIVLHIQGREGASSGGSLVSIPSTEQVPIRISDNDVKPPYKITFESRNVFLIPRSFDLGAFIEEDKAKIHVSGVSLVWRRSDMVAEALIIELGISKPGDYKIKIILEIEDCNAETSYFEYDYTTKSGVNWDFVYVELQEDFKVTDIYALRTIIVEQDQSTLEGEIGNVSK